MPLVHLWSLAVEEQFYLLWPAVVLLCDRTALRRVCIALVIGAPLVRLALVLGGAGADAPYVLTPARVDALALGALLALVGTSAGEADRQRALARRIAGWTAAGIAVLFVLRQGLDSSVPEMQVAGFSLIALLAAALLAMVLLAPPDHAAVRVLRHPWLRACGTVSYGLYVLHYPLFGILQRAFDLKEAPLVFGSVIPAAVAFAIGATLLSLVVAALSWFLWERPFLRLKDRLSGPVARGA